MSNQNTSHNLMLELVGHNKRVLDVGCSTGYLARAMVARGCTVSGVEYDPVAAELARPTLERLVIGNLEDLDLVEELGASQFDVVVFEDVLEHLRDPLPVLRQARSLLMPGGFVVVSLPNVAHGSVRLSLLLGRFEYTEVGLLDSTHLRFFTRDSCLDLMRRAGLIGVDMRRTTVGIFETEPVVRPEEISKDVVAQVLEDPDATTYQFVLRAIADDGDAALHHLTQRVESLRRQLHALERTERRNVAERERLEAIVRDLRGENAVAQTQARDLQQERDDSQRVQNEWCGERDELLRERDELLRERDELRRIARIERERHRAAERRLERRLTLRLAALAGLRRGK